MTMTLYHCSGARSVRPLWTLLEMGVPHELVTLQFPPRVFNKEFKEINPLGTVPCLIDGDLNLTESAGICQYLVDRYGPTDIAVGRDEADYGAYLNWLHRSDRDASPASCPRTRSSGRGWIISRPPRSCRGWNIRRPQLHRTHRPRGAPAPPGR